MSCVLARMRNGKVFVKEIIHSTLSSSFGISIVGAEFVSFKCERKKNRKKNWNNLTEKLKSSSSTHTQRSHSFHCVQFHFARQIPIDMGKQCVAAADESTLEKRHPMDTHFPLVLWPVWSSLILYSSFAREEVNQAHVSLLNSME